MPNVMTSRGTPLGAQEDAQPSRWQDVSSSLRATSVHWLFISLGAVIAVTGIMVAFRAQLGVLNVLLLYLLLTFFLALGGGLWPAVLSAVLGFLAFNFFFIPPFYTLDIAAPDHALTLFVYLGVAVVTARLVSGMQARTEQALRESRRMALLAELNAALIGDVTLDAILARIAERIVAVYGAQGCRVLVRGEDDELRTAAYFPEQIGPTVDRTGRSLAEWAVANRTPVGRSGRGGRIVGRNPVPSASLPGGDDVLYLPVMTKDRIAGVLEVTGRPGRGVFRAEDQRTLTTFVDQAALALERARLSAEAAQAFALTQSDELKSALLAAVSHDLRTPLASIKASATSLLDDSVEWDAETRRDFLTAIDEETDRLTLMVSNLLDLSRIEGGALRPQKDWYDIDELIVDVRARLAPRTRSHPLTITVEPDLPLLRFDYVQIAQVLVNLIENAVKYTPDGTPIAVAAHQIPGAIEISVHDDGPGIPPEHQLRLFDKFYRAYVPTAAPGAGIGLAISKGLVAAHGGHIWVESEPGSGTTFHFTLPLPSPSRARSRAAEIEATPSGKGQAA
ncbi:MAG: histidine kinase [Thermomicrobiales bacterium]|nr:histidine kinase [Thermomicrobiales bacterium]